MTLRGRDRYHRKTIGTCQAFQPRTALRELQTVGSCDEGQTDDSYNSSVQVYCVRTHRVIMSCVLSYCCRAELSCKPNASFTVPVVILLCCAVLYLFTKGTLPRTSSNVTFSVQVDAEIFFSYQDSRREAPRTPLYLCFGMVIASRLRTARNDWLLW